ERLGLAVVQGEEVARGEVQQGTGDAIGGGDVVVEEVVHHGGRLVTQVHRRRCCFDRPGTGGNGEGEEGGQPEARRDGRRNGKGQVDIFEVDVGVAAAREDPQAHGGTTLRRFDGGSLGKGSSCRRRVSPGRCRAGAACARFRPRCRRRTAAPASAWRQ